jgi:phosphinothricin acetyltransferase
VIGPDPHEAVGFVRVGAYHGVGFKAGAWLDVGLWQRDLAARDAEPEEPALP